MTMRGLVGRAACCGCAVAAATSAAAVAAVPVRGGEVSQCRAYRFATSMPFAVGLLVLLHIIHRLAYIYACR